jgi:hypothetical protein
MPSLNTKLATAPNVSANYVLKATTSTTIGNSLIFDNGSNTAIGGTSITDGHLLNIIGSSATSNIGIVLNKTNATAQIWGITNVGALTFYDYTAAAERMRITTNGNVGIGTSSPANILHTYAALPRVIADTSTRFAVFNLYYQGSEKGAFYLDNQNKDIILEANGDNTYGLRFSTGGSERMRINSQGQVLINTTTASRAGLLEMSGSSVQYNLLSITDTGVAQVGVYYIAFWNSSGNLAGGVQHPTNSTVSYYTGPSDQRLKSNIKDVEESVLPLFDDVKLKTYNHIADEDESIVYKGFLAQEMVDRFPEAYGLDKDGYYTFNPNGYIPYLVKAISEQQALIQELSAKVSALENKS